MSNLSHKKVVNDLFRGLGCLLFEMVSFRKCVTESKQCNKFLPHHLCDCRPARTVIVGGLQNPKMVQSVIAKAKKLGPVEDVRHPLDEAELISRGNISNLGHSVVYLGQYVNLSLIVSPCSTILISI